MITKDPKLFIVTMKTDQTAGMLQCFTVSQLISYLISSSLADIGKFTGYSMLKRE